MENDEGNQKQYPRTTTIPKLFWSDLEGAPFKKCISCQEKLLESKQPYLIEKAVKGFDGERINATLYEYAVCLNCASQMNLKLSVSSRQRMEDFFQSNVDFEARLQHLKEVDDKEWLTECLVHHLPVNEEGECQLFGLCQGDQFIYKEFPYMIRMEALDEMMDLISAETLRELDNFKEELIDGPPELKELFDKVGPRMLI